MSDCALHTVYANASSDSTGHRWQVVVGSQEGSRTWRSVVGGECDVVTSHFKKNACDKIKPPEVTETMIASITLCAIAERLGQPHIS